MCGRLCLLLAAAIPSLVSAQQIDLAERQREVRAREMALVELLPSGTLAMSSGPVFDPKRERIGTYNSTWRRDPDRVWRVIFDSGCP